MKMNPITNVTDPHTIRKREAPRRSEANPAGVTGSIDRLGGYVRRGGGEWRRGGPGVGRGGG